MNYDCILFRVLFLILFYSLLSTLDTGSHHELQVIDASIGEVSGAWRGL